MFDVVMNVIKSKNYELKDILTKIDTLWVQGSITEEQRLSLITEAQNNAMVENSIDVLSKLYEVDMRVKAIEETIKKLLDGENQGGTEEGGTEEGGTEEETTTYLPYIAGNWYRNGDKVSYGEENYVCIAPDGVVCVWSPVDFPDYWQLINEELESDAPLAE